MPGLFSKYVQMREDQKILSILRAFIGAFDIDFDKALEVIPIEDDQKARLRDLYASETHEEEAEVSQ